MNKLFGIGLIGLGIIILIFVFYKNSGVAQKTQPFSTHSLLNSSWDKYKAQFINSDGRVLDHSQNDVTTSEGQGYGMLRAVWIDDKPTFDNLWKWTSQSLKRPNDNLFGWRWGQKKDKSYGFLDGGGDNSASDADTDIALSLLFASKRWNDPSYKDQAEKIISDIWQNETQVLGNNRYLVAGNWAKGNDKIVINPSYFSPYAWRIFAEVDTTHDWKSLIDPSYGLLNRVGTEKLDKDKGVGLPPDWVTLSANGTLSAVGQDNLDTDYSFDAMRVPFRIYLDYLWFKEDKAKNYLENSYKILGSDFSKNNKLPIGYSHDGNKLKDLENPVMYATSLGYFEIANKDLANNIYQNKILKLYSSDQDTFSSNLPYYEQNWLWFGVSLHENFLINLWQSK